MSDPIAQAAAQMQVQTEVSAPVAAAIRTTLDTLTAEAGTAAVGESMPALSESPSPAMPASNAESSVASTETVSVQAGSASAEVAQPGESAPSSPASTTITTPEPSSAELPRESHLMLLEHKLAAMHAKFKTGERIVIDEFEQILGHIRAVL